MPCVLGASHTQAASDSPCTVKAVDLSFCQLQDDDLDGIAAALARFNDVETLDLQYNELQVRVSWAACLSGVLPQRSKAPLKRSSRAGRAGSLCSEARGAACWRRAACAEASAAQQQQV